MTNLAIARKHGKALTKQRRAKALLASAEREVNALGRLLGKGPKRSKKRRKKARKKRAKKRAKRSRKSRRR